MDQKMGARIGPWSKAKASLAVRWPPSLEDLPVSPGREPFLWSEPHLSKHRGLEWEQNCGAAVECRQTSRARVLPVGCRFPPNIWPTHKTLCPPRQARAHHSLWMTETRQLARGTYRIYLTLVSTDSSQTVLSTESIKLAGLLPSPSSVN